MTLSETLSVEDLNEPDSSHHNWDINDAKFPPVTVVDEFDLWPQGHRRHIYCSSCEEARRHTSGWAMRNTNNHNVHILKKSCLGVLLCSANCRIGPEGAQLTLRPAICDKARRKQCGKACHNPVCSGSMFLQPCRGHCGYPVTHLWRRHENYIYCQTKGNHDHPLPDIKPTREQKRRPVKRLIKDELEEFSNKRSRFVDEIQKCGQLSVYGDRLCSCPPFECLCSKRTQASSNPHQDPAMSPPHLGDHRLTPSQLKQAPSVSSPGYPINLAHPTTTSARPLEFSGHLYPSSYYSMSTPDNNGARPYPAADNSMLSQLMSPTYQHGFIHNCAGQHPSSFGPSFNSSFSSTSPISPPGLLDMKQDLSLRPQFMYNSRQPQLQCSSPYITSAFSLLPGYNVASSSPQGHKMNSEEVSGRFLDQGSSSFHLPLLYKS